MRKIRKIIFVSAQHLCNKQLFLKHCTHLIQSIITGSGEILKHVPHLIMHKGLVSMSKLWRNSKKNKTKQKEAFLAWLQGGNYETIMLVMTWRSLNWKETEARRLTLWSVLIVLFVERAKGIIHSLFDLSWGSGEYKCRDAFFSPPCWSGCPYCFRVPRLEPSLAINRIIFKG